MPEKNMLEIIYTKVSYQLRSILYIISLYGCLPQSQLIFTTLIRLSMIVPFFSFCKLGDSKYTPNKS